MLALAVLPLFLATAPGPAELLSALEGGPAAHPLAKAHVELAGARAAARSGSLDAAAAGFDALGLPRVVRWAGPAENTSGARFASPVEGEDDAPFTVARDPREGWLDLGAQLPEREEVRVALRFVVESDRARPAALRVGVAGQLQALVNGAEVLRVEGERSAALDQRAAGVWLERGRNLVVLRLGNLDGDLRLFARFTAPDGATIPGLRAHLDDTGLVKAALRKRPEVLDAVAAARGEAAAMTPAAAGLAARLFRALDLGDRGAAVPEVAALAERWAAGEGGASAWILAADAWLPIDPEAARARYAQALEVDPNSGRAQLGLARVLDELERPEAARRAYSLARAASPEDPEVLEAVWLHALLDGQDTLRARRALKELTREHPRALLLAAALEEAERVGDGGWRAEVLAALRASDRADDLVLLADRRAAEARGDLEALLEVTERRLAHFPAEHDAAERLVLARLHGGEAEIARALVEERLRAYPARPEPARLAATVALLQGDRARAASRSAEALARSPGDLKTLRLHRALQGVSPPLVDMEIARASDPLAGGDEAGFEVLERRVRVKLVGGGLGSTVREEILRVVDPERAGTVGLVRLPWVEGREVATVLEATRVTRSGARLRAEQRDEVNEGKIDGQYTDARATVMDFGRVEAGDLLVVRTRVDRIGRPWFFGSFFGLVEGIGGVAPVGRFVLEVEVPDAVKLIDAGVGYQASELVEDGVRRYRYEAADVARVVPERAMPAYIEIAPYVSVSTMGDWTELARWYRALVEPQRATDAGARALARALVLDAESPREKVRRVYEHVVRKVRYVGIELGIHGWRPYPVTEVLRRGYGDCKDTATLLVALLDEVGVEARVVLVRTRDRGRPPGTPPSMWMFNHAIAYVPALDLWLDGTATDAGIGELPDLDRGAFALVLPRGDEQAAPTKIPLGAATESANRSRYTVHLDAKGSARMTGAERFSGVRAPDMRALLVRDDADRLLEAQLASVFSGARLVELRPTPLSLSAAEIGYDLEVEAPSLARREERALIVPITLYRHELEASWARASTRRHELVLGTPGRTVNEMRFVTPPGFVIEELPPGGRAEVAGVSFEQTVEATEDGWRVVETLELSAERVSPADYEALRAAARAADGLQRAEVRLRREGDA